MPKVLIVDDEADLAAGLAQLLASLCQVTIAADVPAALAELEQVEPDLVLLDVILPRGTGVQVLERAAERAAAGNPAPRFLIMSGFAPDLDLSRFASMVVGVLAKPFKVDDLLTQVRSVLDSTRTDQSAPAAAVGPDPAPSTGHILVVDDDIDVAEQVRLSLRRRGYQVTVAASSASALAAIGRRPFDLIITDWILPGMSGIELLQEVRRRHAQTPVVMLSGFATPDFTRRALRLGAADVLPKPVPPKVLHLAVEKCLMQAGLAPAGAAEVVPAGIEDRAPAPPAPGRVRPTGSSGGSGREGAATTRYTIDDILGSSSRIQQVRELLVRVAGLHSTVLCTGETGTGKELFAQALHRLSNRRGRPFVALNAAAIPESLLESELFGYGTGAFTGAKKEGQPGKFVQADGGTLFLDEIGDLPLPLQSKLLRVLQEGEVDPVGGRGPRRVDVRVVAATHRDLLVMARENRFRSDLYYRLNVVHVHLPALRERPEDIPALVARFLTDLATTYSVAVKRVSAEAMALLQRYRWPGNVRELRNVVEQAYAFSLGDTIDIDSLPDGIQACTWAPAVEPAERGQNAAARSGVFDVGRPGPDARAVLERALATAGGNKVKAARLLGISRATLYVRLKLAGLV